MVDDIHPEHYLKDPKLWELWCSRYYYGPIMGNAGFISSTVGLVVVWV